MSPYLEKTGLFQWARFFCAQSVDMHLRHVLTHLCVAACAVAASAANAALDQARTPSTLDVKGFRIQVEVARTQEARARGLMGRTALAPDSGMLFVFDAPERICMWMRNTPLPLTVAFLDDQGVIINLADMQPRTDTVHCAQANARFALEMTQGWFQNRGIQARDRVKLTP
ncbi:MAG: hypothetical protein RLZZ290_217 [Pseudomonadota bacterium]|jgi:uncharacterized protein